MAIHIIIIIHSHAGTNCVQLLNTSHTIRVGESICIDCLPGTLIWSVVAHIDGMKRRYCQCDSLDLLEKDRCRIPRHMFETGARKLHIRGVTLGDDCNTYECCHYESGTGTCNNLTLRVLTNETSISGESQRNKLNSIIQML